MKFEKIVPACMEKCYAVSALCLLGKDTFLFASEAEGGGCYAVTYPSLVTKQVWDAPGGTMCMVPIPGGNGAFLAVQHFFPPFLATTCRLVTVTPQNNGTFVTKPFMDIPYLHRFTLLETPQSIFLVASVLCGEKTDKDDWSQPGYVMVGKFHDKNTPVSFTPLVTGLTRNHGFCHGRLNARPVVLVTADEGVFALYPPQNPTDSWQTEKLINRPVSEAVIVDLDKNGVDEIVTLEPFHGAKLCVNQQVGGEWVCAYALPEQLPFAHALWGGTLAGEPIVICGFRREKMELFYLAYQQGIYKKQLIETGAGSSNIVVWKTSDGQEILASAAREQDQCVLYRVTKEDCRNGGGKG